MARHAVRLIELLQCLGWPLEDLEEEDATFEHPVEAMSLPPGEERRVERVLTLRPVSGFDQLLLLVYFRGQGVPIAASRRIVEYFRHRQAARKYRLSSHLSNIILLAQSEDLVKLCQFQGETAFNAKLASCEFRADLAQWILDPHLNWSSVAQRGIKFPEAEFRAVKTKPPRFDCREEDVLELAPDLLSLYWLSRRRPSLSLEEEHELIKRHRQGDQAAQFALIVQLLPSCFRVALRYHWIHRELHGTFEDAFYGAMEGAFEGLRRFDLSIQFRLAHFAHFWIRRGASRAYPTNLGGWTIPAYKWETISKLHRTQRFDLDDLLPATEPCEEQEFSWAEILEDDFVADDKAIALYRRLCEEMLLIDTLSDDEIPYHGVEPFDAVLDRLEVSWLVETAPLSDRDREILLERFGVVDGRGRRTLEETASKFGVTRERVRQVELRALEKIRKHLRYEPSSGSYTTTTSAPSRRGR